MVIGQNTSTRVTLVVYKNTIEENTRTFRWCTYVCRDVAAITAALLVNSRFRSLLTVLCIDDICFLPFSFLRPRHCLASPIQQISGGLPFCPSASEAPRFRLPNTKCCLLLQNIFLTLLVKGFRVRLKEIEREIELFVCLALQ